jgi:hypothetical protein
LPSGNLPKNRRNPASQHSTPEIKSSNGVQSPRLFCKLKSGRWLRKRLATHEMLPFSNYKPDVEVIKKNGVKVFMAAGKRTLDAGKYYGRTAPILVRSARLRDGHLPRPPHVVFGYAEGMGRHAARRPAKWGEAEPS